jgi:hypothetical protein
MSNIDDIVKSAQGGQLIDNLSDRLGLASWQTEVAVLALAPALSAALARAAESPDQLRPVVAAMSEPRHKAAFEDAESAHSQESVEAGDAIVAYLFGSAAAAGEASQLAARASGLRPDVLQGLLPVLVSILSGGLSSTLSERGLEKALSEAPSGPVAPDAAAEPVPVEKPRGLAAILAAIFGRRPKPAAVEPLAEPKGSPADVLDEALAQIRQIFATEAPVAEDHKAELDALLAKAFGPPRG